MKLSAPKKSTWMVGVILGGLGIVSAFVAIPTLSANAFWLVAAGFAALVLGTMLDGV